MGFPRIAISVLNYNGIEDTRSCLQKLLQTNYPKFHIFVVDNGSKKNEATILKREFPDKRITIIRNRKNLGFSGGNNGVFKRLKREKYMVLVNNDVTLSSNWLTPLVKALEKDNTIGAAQPKILWTKNKKYFDYAGASGGFLDYFGYPFTRGRIFETQEEDKGQYNTPCEIFWTSGATMIIRTDVLKKIGFFDTRFFNYMEEIDLCFRMHRNGYRTVCVPSSSVFHKVASTASRNQNRKRFWEHRNNIMMIVKNYPLKNLVVVLPIRILYEYVSVLYYIYRRRFGFALAVLKSQVALCYYIPILLYERISQKKDLHSFPFNRIVYTKSIITAYFLQKKRYFSELDFFPKKIKT